MSRFTVLAASGFLASAMMAAPAFADEGGGHLCHSATGAPISDLSQCCYNPSVDGPTNANAYPFCPGVLPASDQYPTLDRASTIHGDPCTTGNCAPPAELSNVKPFYDQTGVVTAQAPAPAPAPVPATTVVQTAQAASAPPAYGAVPFNAAGLSNTGLAVGAVGAAALAGLIAIIASDDDDDAAVATTVTSGT